MAKKQVDIFSSRAIQALRRDHETLRRDVQSLRSMVRALTGENGNNSFEVGKTDDSGITAMSGGTPGSGTVNLYRIRSDRSVIDTGRDVTCYNIAGPVPADTYIAMVRDTWHTPWTFQAAGQITELMLAENHPGKGVVFKCYLGIWCPQDHSWRYNCADGCSEWVWAIDHRYDVPYPTIGARGLFTPRASNTYGTIWECLNLDCSSPGTCTAQGIDQPCPETDSTNYDGAC